MNKKYIGIAIIVVVIILLIVFIPRGEVNNVDTPQTPDQVREFAPTELVAIHTFEEGVHTLSGEVDLPTPCHTLSHDVIVAESFPEQVTVSFETEADDEVICAQVITPTQFEVTFEASEDASIEVEFNDRSVPLTIVDENQTEESETTE